MYLTFASLIEGAPSVENVQKYDGENINSIILMDVGLATEVRSREKEHTTIKRTLWPHLSYSAIDQT